MVASAILDERAGRHADRRPVGRGHGRPRRHHQPVDRPGAPARAAGAARHPHGGGPPAHPCAAAEYKRRRQRRPVRSPAQVGPPGPAAQAGNRVPVLPGLLVLPCRWPSGKLGTGPRRDRRDGHGRMCPWSISDGTLTPDPRPGGRARPVASPVGPGTPGGAGADPVARRPPGGPRALQPGRALPPDRRAAGRSVGASEALGVDASGAGVVELLVDPALDEAVLCTHGEQIGEVFDELHKAGLELADPPRWPKGCTWILRRHAGHGWRGTYLAPAGGRAGQGPATMVRRRQGASKEDGR
jgi:hypothetical protein